MGLLLLYWGFLIVGYIIACRQRRRADKFSWVSKAMMGAVYVLVFIMGLRMGVNEQVTSNLGSIGMQATVITVFAVAGSMLAIFGVRKALGIDRYGNIMKKDPIKCGAGNSTKDGEIGVAAVNSPEYEKTVAAASNSSESKHSSISSSDIKSTVVILILVAVGMCIGSFVMVRYMTGILDTFDVVSGNALTVFLCVLLAFVGFDLGLSGNVTANIKTVGIRACAFPVAAVVGSLILGTLSGMFFGFSVKEGLAISAGFGWYTYAPTVIASAGPQYVTASAVSFMYNVIRELSGIVFIPILARKTGYLEVTGIPGVAAMDVCMPIVERSCRHDTVVYSFAIGLLMCIVTSVMVPLIMGV